MDMFNQQEEQLMVESKETLSKIVQAKKMKSETELQEVSKNIARLDRGKYFFEDYDQVAYEGKVRVDTLYYDQLLQKLEEGMLPNVQKAIISLYTTINNIYEFVNIKPDIYGKGINVDILNDSIETSRRKLSKVIYEYLDRNFYSLTASQRKEKYFDEHKDLTKTLVNEGADLEDAMIFSVKTCVMENIVRNIAFPFSAWSRVKFLCEDHDYGKIFDQHDLLALVETFEKKINSLAKIVATCV